MFQQIFRSLGFRTVFVMIAAIAIVGSTAQQATAQSETNTITMKDRQMAVRYLEVTLENFLKSIEGLTEEQWRFKSAEDRWSIAEIAEHIAVSESAILNLVTEKVLKSDPTPQFKEEAKAIDNKIIPTLTDRTNRAQAPEMLRPTNRFATKEDLINEFKAARHRTLHFMVKSQADMRSHFAPFGPLKRLDAYQWIVMSSAHSARHTLQIEEVKADPNYPKN